MTIYNVHAIVFVYNVYCKINILCVIAYFIYYILYVIYYFIFFILYVTMFFYIYLPLICYQ